MPVVQWEEEGSEEVIDAADRINAAHTRAARQAIALERGNVMLGRSFLMMGMLSTRAIRGLAGDNKALSDGLRVVEGAIGIVSAGLMAYNMLLRIQGLMHKRNTAAIAAETVATNALAGARTRAGAAGMMAGRSPAGGLGGGLGGGAGGLLGRLGPIGAGLALGGLGAEFLAPAIVLAARGKNPFGSDYKTFSQSMSRPTPTGTAYGGPAFQQFNEFNAPVTNESIRQLDDANKRMSRQFGESR